MKRSHSKVHQLDDVTHSLNIPRSSPSNNKTHTDKKLPQLKSRVEEIDQSKLPLAAYIFLSSSLSLNIGDTDRLSNAQAIQHEARKTLPEKRGNVGTDIDETNNRARVVGYIYQKFFGALRDGILKKIFPEQYGSVLSADESTLNVYWPEDLVETLEQCFPLYDKKTLQRYIEVLAYALAAQYTGGFTCDGMAFVTLLLYALKMKDDESIRVANIATHRWIELVKWPKISEEDVIIDGWANAWKFHHDCEAGHVVLRRDSKYASEANSTNSASFSITKPAILVLNQILTTMLQSIKASDQVKAIYERLLQEGEKRYQNKSWSWRRDKSNMTYYPIAPSILKEEFREEAKKLLVGQMQYVPPSDAITEHLEPQVVTQINKINLDIACLAAGKAVGWRIRPAIAKKTAEDILSTANKIAFYEEQETYGRTPELTSDESEDNEAL